MCERNDVRDRCEVRQAFGKTNRHSLALYSWQYAEDITNQDEGETSTVSSALYRALHQATLGWEDWKAHLK